jgi:TonB family protein
VTAALEREAISFAPLAAMAPSDGRPEPQFATIPGVIGAEGVVRLDPARAIAAEPERPVRSAQRSPLPYALLTSVALHLLPALLLIDWHVAPTEVPPPIPVRLVVVRPKPPPASPKPAPRRPPPRETRRPAPGRLASEDSGSPTGQRRATGSDSAAAAPREAPTQMVSALPPPRVDPLALPQPVDQLQQDVLPLPLPTPKPAATREARRETRPRTPAHLGALGPAATRDEYLAYCNALIKQHFDMLPASFIAGRHGRTVLALSVLDDGRIARIAVAESSGYHDIDERVEKMVAAVHRFPPVPQWFQGTQVELLYELPFPRGIDR